VEPLPLAYIYPGTPSYLQLMKVTKPTSNNVESVTPPPPQTPSFFVNETLRMEILQKNALTLAQPDHIQYPDIPAEVENYHDLVPMELMQKPVSTVLGYQSSTYKATNIKNGTKYCLRRIHGL
jgi:PAB-dependent poly(A)-specific ribonuclease subunit 3